MQKRLNMPFHNPLEKNTMVCPSPGRPGCIVSPRRGVTTGPGLERSPPRAACCCGEDTHSLNSSVWNLSNQAARLRTAGGLRCRRAGTDSLRRRVSAAAVRTQRRDGTSEIRSCRPRCRRRRILESPPAGIGRRAAREAATKSVTQSIRFGRWAKLRRQRASGRGGQPGERRSARGAPGKNKRHYVQGVRAAHVCDALPLSVAAERGGHASLSESHRPARRRTADGGPPAAARVDSDGHGATDTPAQREALPAHRGWARAGRTLARAPPAPREALPAHRGGEHKESGASVLLLHRFLHPLALPIHGSFLVRKGALRSFQYLTVLTLLSVPVSSLLCSSLPRPLDHGRRRRAGARGGAVLRPRHRSKSAPRPRATPSSGRRGPGPGHPAPSEGRLRLAHYALRVAQDTGIYSLVKLVSARRSAHKHTR